MQASGGGDRGSVAAGPAGATSGGTTAVPAQPHQQRPAAAPPPVPSTLQVVLVPALSDNYIHIIRDQATGATAAVDPGHAAPVQAALAERGWRLDFVINTHHHADHVGGNLELKRCHEGLQIVGPRADAARIPGIDIPLGQGDTWHLGATQFQTLEVSGHTRGHVAFFAPTARAVFCGDALFALGCGMLFEGDAATAWASLCKLAALPPDTRVYCAHEYTASNAKFAASVCPGNAALTERRARVDAARERGEPTVPSLLSEELETNPFLRPRDPDVRSAVGAASDASDAEVFGALRRKKDGVKGRVVLALYRGYDLLPPPVTRFVGQIF